MWDSKLAQLPRQGVAVTPSDTTEIAANGGLYVGTGGNVAVHTIRDAELKVEGKIASITSLVFKNVASGQVLPIQVARVLSTGTTASDIIALKSH